MVGGGPGAFIGDVHRRAARLDGLATLVAGAFSSDPETSRRFAAEIGVERAYGSYQEMAEQEAARPDGIEVVSIVTPNWLHAPAAFYADVTFDQQPDLLLSSWLVLPSPFSPEDLFDTRHSSHLFTGGAGGLIHTSGNAASTLPRPALAATAFLFA